MCRECAYDVVSSLDYRPCLCNIRACICLSDPFKFRWSIGYTCNSSYDNLFRSINNYRCCIFPCLCDCAMYQIVCPLLHIDPGKAEVWSALLLGCLWCVQIIDQFHKYHNAPVPYPQCTIQSKNAHISALNDALWDMKQVHCGICELGQLGTLWPDGRIRLFCTWHYLIIMQTHLKTINIHSF